MALKDYALEKGEGLQDCERSCAGSFLANTCWYELGSRGGRDWHARPELRSGGGGALADHAWEAHRASRSEKSW